MALFFYIALALVATCHGDVAPAGAQVDPAAPPRSAVCTKRNAYYKVENSCDKYIECNDFVASDQICPEGLHYNAAASWPEYACGYPMDVKCTEGVAQPPQATADCPHQYGYFASPAAPADNCGQYRMCVAGRAIEMICPTGLAFNPDTGRCDWPDLVASCKADVFLGFTCPEPPKDANGQLLDVIVNYKYEGNCYYFFSCEKGRARLLSCDNGLAFDHNVGRCVDADYVQCAQTSS